LTPEEAEDLEFASRSVQKTVDIIFIYLQYLGVRLPLVQFLGWQIHKGESFKEELNMATKKKAKKKATKKKH